ncbi:Menaquinol-cytochrome c reductase cytochrome b subunit [Thalassoglobus neptunius]|uniref:Menaquinol-cytochrome c reductase cytochrome b subunit n=1 Tax=Thalassoglobus neptunius TaxID=1938619 RepID=A0A5C5WZ03_9PLAN|nr:cytochrome bc complex cytochrome b subunit [Thalassoglobus neptunius]TWT55838.1 Menaquinol-cytochrome c reductase cytochrome b subunit [Thalassoglobus neptunius]
MKRLLDWLDHRTGYRDLMHEALNEPIPGGAKWRYVWGSTLTFTFFVQVITGFCLWMAYSPSATTAWESVYFIQHQMVFGWVVRGIHHFAAQAMMILLILHLMQVVIDGAYRAPREVNFWLGLVLMQIVMFLGLTGYLLPWDQKGYYATRVATEIMGSAPFVGPWIQQLVQGGPSYGNHTLTRFFALHAGVLPALLVMFLGLHIYVFRRHALHAIKNEGEEDGVFWPDQILKDGVACLAVLAAIMGATLYWHGAELTAPANPAEAYSAARPEWYYLFLFKFLQFEFVSQWGEATHLGEALGAIVIPGVLFTILALMPITAYFKWGHRFNVAYLWSVLGIAGVLTGMAYYEDWYADTPEGRDFRQAVEEAHRDGARTVALAESKTGIPPSGAALLLANDPLTQGPKIFEQYCLSCHQTESRFDDFSEAPQAPGLADPHIRDQIDFGSRDWIRSVLTDFGGHFAALANIEGNRGEAAEAILEGSMKDWSDSNAETLTAPENADDYEALVEFLYTQSQRPDALSPESEVVLRGMEIFTTGELTNGSVDACVDCHSMHPVVVDPTGLSDRWILADEALSEDLQPVLTGYGGTEWVLQMVADPQAHYAGEYGNNAMPGFADQMTHQELEMVSKWLAEDFYVVPAGEETESH